MHNSLILEKGVIINTAINNVWNALINKEILRRYIFGCDVISEWTTGSSVTWINPDNGTEYGKGMILKVSPGRSLTYSVMVPGHSNVDVSYLITTYSLSSIDGETVLTVSQGDFSLFEDSRQWISQSASSWESVLSNLKRLLEQKAEPMTAS